MTGPRPTLADTVDAITAIQYDLTNLTHLAETSGLAVWPDATISDIRPVTLPADQVAAYQEQRHAEMTRISDTLRSVLTRADQVDTALADMLTRAAAGQIDDGTATTLAAAASTAAGDTAPPPPPTRWRPGRQPRVVGRAVDSTAGGGAGAAPRVGRQPRRHPRRRPRRA